ncbi:MAG TPA: PqqD family protein [Actinomycetota bacterium]
MDRELPRPEAGSGEPRSEGLTVPPSYVPHRVPTVSELEVGEGLILYVEEADLIHRLNASAALVWRLFDGVATAGQLSREIAEEYELDVDEVSIQIASLVGELDALGLVSGQPEAERPTE